MRIDQILAATDDPVFSFEFFPPKTEEGEQNLRAALEALQPLEPDFASVTYGAGGSTQGRTLEVTKWLKDDAELKSIPVVAVTAFAMKGDEERIREGGCEAYLSKPISVGKFIETVRHFLGTEEKQ